MFASREVDKFAEGNNGRRKLPCCGSDRERLVTFLESVVLLASLYMLIQLFCSGVVHSGF